MVDETIAGGEENCGRWVASSRDEAMIQNVTFVIRRRDTRVAGDFIASIAFGLNAASELHKNNSNGNSTGMIKRP